MNFPEPGMQLVLSVSAQRRKTLSKQGIATVRATTLVPESGPEYDLPDNRLDF